MLHKMSEKLCLQWNDFKENAINAFGSLRDDKNFADVTFACEDGQQVEVHKVILASSSPFFKTLLGRNKHPHPMIYMRGVKSSNLLANVSQDDFDPFLALAEELQLKGLMGNSGDRFGDSNNDEKYAPQQSVPNANNETVSQKIPTKLQNQTKFRAKGTVALPGDSGLGIPGNLPVDFTELDEKVKSLMEKSQNRDKSGRFASLCKVCGKEGFTHHIKKHIEFNHLDDIVIPCNLCEKTFRTRSALRQHTATNHS